jgi:hypothetical protein
MIGTSTGRMVGTSWDGTCIRSWRNLPEISRICLRTALTGTAMPEPIPPRAPRKAVAWPRSSLAQRGGRRPAPCTASRAL